jgi:type I restriction enzyme S subunit
MNNWPVKTIGDVCELVNGATPDTKVKKYWGGKHAWITPAEMGNLDSPFLSMSRRTLSDEGLASCSATLVPPKTVILSSRAPIGHLVINEVPMATNQGCKSLIPKDGLDFSFLYYYLKANVQVLESLGTGTTFKELSGTQLKTVKIPVPPLEEQKRIVALLDAATARVTELTTCYEQARTRANDLFVSAVRDALESNPDWPIKTLGDICLGIKRQDPAASAKSEFIYIDLSAVNQTTKHIDGSRIIDVDDAPGRARQLVETGDVLVSTVRPNLNAVGLVGAELDGATASTGFCVLRPNRSIIEPGLLFAWVQNQLFIDELTSQAKGASYPAVTDNIVKALEIPVPPLEEQKKIVARLDSMRVKTSEMVAAYDVKLFAAKNLRQSILEAAFAGEL